MSEKDDNTIDNIDNNNEEIPQVEAPIKTKKPVSPERYEQLKQARLKGAEKKKEMKDLKTKAKQLPIEEMKISAMKYDQLQKQKEEIIKPIEKEIIVEKEITKPVEKIKDKKKRIIKKIIYEDGSEDEVEDLRYIQSQQRPPPPQNKYMSLFSNDDSYTNLVYQSACDRLKEKVQDERTKYLIKSLMPNYG